MMANPFKALVDYEDTYVQPVILEALRSQLDSATYEIIDSLDGIDGDRGLALLQFRSYESIDFELGLSQRNSLFNAYVIRKALIRKHYLSNTIFSWVTKYPKSILKKHFKPAVDFELDYAEFLDDALVEAFELRDAFARNEGKEASERDWWILKPSMSDRGQGIRLFSTEEELQTIFETWEAELGSDREDEDENQDNENGNHQKDYITTSDLRHFVAQPYIDPPLLITDAPFGGRKFHIRTYVVAAGALRVYVYKEMLALFASEAYSRPSEMSKAPEAIDGIDLDLVLEKMRNVHLTNTCVQTALKGEGSNPAESSDNVYLLSALPLRPHQHEAITSQIQEITAELFRATLAHPTNFQPLPQSFEIFGIDFLVSSEPAANSDVESDALNVWLLEVNAFPDFAQTGDMLKDVVVKGLFEEVFSTIVSPHFGFTDETAREGSARLLKVLEVDMKR